MDLCLSLHKRPHKCIIYFYTSLNIVRSVDIYPYKKVIYGYTFFPRIDPHSISYIPSSCMYLLLFSFHGSRETNIFSTFPFEWQENGGVVLKRENPHKYLLYKPTVSQFLVFLASGHKELPPNGALMIYISGDGCFSTKPQPEDPR